MCVQNRVSVLSCLLSTVLSLTVGRHPPRRMSSTSILHSQTPASTPHESLPILPILPTLPILPVPLLVPVPVSTTPPLRPPALSAAYSAILRGSGPSPNPRIATPLPALTERASCMLPRPLSRSVLPASAKVAPERKTSKAISFGPSISRPLSSKVLPIALVSISYPIPAHPCSTLGLRLYHCTSSQDLHPSHTRNFGRNIKVSQFIKQKTGVYRSTRQISSRIQVLRSLWRDTEGARVSPTPQHPNTTIPQPRPRL